MTTTATTSEESQITTLEDLYIDELQDLYSAETQIIAALPKMAAAATEPKLKDGFTLHLEQSKEHAARLEQILGRVGKSADGKTCKAMKGLVAEGAEVLKEVAPGSVLDAALIGAAQRIEHYEMAGYGTARTLAQQLGDDESIPLLEKTLHEEKLTNDKLTRVAETLVNPQAAAA